MITCDTQINWGGGEPALHPSLKELYQLFRSVGCRQHFDTNATCYMDFLENDLATGHVTLSCSLMTSNIETYQQIMGKDYCEQAWQNAKQYAATGGDVRAKFIMLPENNGQEEIFVSKCKDCGISIVNLDREIYTIHNSKQEYALQQRAARFTQAANIHGIDVFYGVGFFHTRQNFFDEMQASIDEMQDCLIEKHGRKLHVKLHMSGRSKDTVGDGQIFLLAVHSEIAPIVDMHRLTLTENTAWQIKQ